MGVARLYGVWCLLFGRCCCCSASSYNLHNHCLFYYSVVQPYFHGGCDYCNVEVVPGPPAYYFLFSLPPPVVLILSISSNLLVLARSSTVAYFIGRRGVRRNIKLVSRKIVMNLITNVQRVLKKFEYNMLTLFHRNNNR